MSPVFAYFSLESIVIPLSQPRCLREEELKRLILQLSLNSQREGSATRQVATRADHEGAGDYRGLSPGSRQAQSPDTPVAHMEEFHVVQCLAQASST